MRARAEQPGAGRDDRAPQAVERVDRLAGAVADVGDELELAGVQLALDRPVDRPDALLDGGRGVDLRAGERVDEEQLLLDARP